MSARTLQQFRHPRQRWIALVALLVMLFNQVALAEHLCRVSFGRHTTSVQQPADRVAPALRCHGLPDGKMLPDASQIACSAHCDDAAKQVRDLTPPLVPALIGLGSEVALLRPIADASATAIPPPSADGVRDRHGGQRRVLLI